MIRLVCGLLSMQLRARNRVCARQLLGRPEYVSVCASLLCRVGRIDTAVFAAGR